MKKFLMIAIVVAVLASLMAMPVLAKPPSRSAGKSNNATVLLVSKDTEWNPVWPGPFGKLKYHLSNPGGFQARLQVHGLAPNSWHLLTLQGYADDTTGNQLGEVGYYGVVLKPAWADIALFQTDAEGNTNLVVPVAFPPGVVDPVHGALSAPSLPTGIYIGVTVVVKFINTGATPDWGVMTWGGTAVLFEDDVMKDFTVGP